MNDAALKAMRMIATEKLITLTAREMALSNSTFNRAWDKATDAAGYVWFWSDELFLWVRESY